LLMRLVGWLRWERCDPSFSGALAVNSADNAPLKAGTVAGGARGTSEVSDSTLIEGRYSTTVTGPAPARLIPGPGADS
jgi:hypothetical protein